MGNQGGSGDGVRKMKEMVDAGLIGDVTDSPVHGPTARMAARDSNAYRQFRQSPANWIGIYGLEPAKKIDYNPDYLPFNWRGWWAFGTGALGDMACHIMDPYLPDITY